jgi:cyclic pyranopterin phosphate synthase
VSPEQSKLQSFFAHSRFHMADVGGKSASFRRALAMGRIRLGATAFERLRKNAMPKGDVLTLAEIAGVQGAKNASQTIPLCHPLPLDHVAVHFEMEAATFSVVAYCTVSTTAKTGVEMEALAGISAALLTVYDLTKPIEPALTISDIRLLLKEGGKKGLWIHPDGLPEALRDIALPDKPMPNKSMLPLQGIRAAVITLSDRAAAGTYADESGALLKTLLQQSGAQIAQYVVLPDDRAQLVAQVKNLASDGDVQLVITTGGTGLAPRDITPEVIQSLCDRMVPGIGELLRAKGMQKLAHACLSRSVAGIVGNMLLIALPGSVAAVRESMEVLQTLLPHALEVLTGKHSSQHHPVNKT